MILRNFLFDKNDRVRQRCRARFAYIGLIRQRRISGARQAEEVIRGELDLRADFAGGDADGIKELGGLVDECGERLLHADGAAAAVDIARGGQQDFLRDHLDRFLAAGASCALEVQRLRAGDDKDVKRAALPLRDEGLEYGVRFLMKHLCHGDRVERAVRGIEMHLMGNALLFEDAHDIGFDRFCHEITAFFGRARPDTGIVAQAEGKGKA